MSDASEMLAIAKAIDAYLIASRAAQECNVTAIRISDLVYLTDKGTYVDPINVAMSYFTDSLKTSGYQIVKVM